jgi:cell division protein FtsN
MARDVKHRIPAFRPEKRKPRWKPFALLGILLAGVGTLVTWTLKSTPSSENPEPAMTQSAIPEEAHFGYFRLLEDRESRVPESRISEEQRNLRLGKAPTPGEFSLLVGTYKTRDKAESVRQQIFKFEALKPRMEEVTLEFASWYRLKLGPYGNLRDANQVRLFLRDHGIDSIIETEEHR